METLEDRRLIANATFMYKLKNNIIDVPSLKNKIRMNSSIYETLNRNIVLIDNRTTNYGPNAPMTSRDFIMRTMTFLNKADLY